jgi:nucleoside-diphosphate-sugar epimerase
VRALVTGASGFIGEALCRQLLEYGHFVRSSTRDSRRSPAGTESFVVDAIDGRTNWTPALHSIDTVFHLAAVAHIVQRPNRQDVERYEEVNADGTERLAHESARAGVRRFVFLSSLKVNGEESPPEGFRETDPPHPEGAYAVSKQHAEERLAEVARASGLSYTIIRPPLVYGPGVRANFLELIRAVDRRRPLPFGSVRNRRSFVYVDNLCSALRGVATFSGIDGETFFVSDGEPVSVAELVRRVAAALGTSPRLFPVPPALLHMLSTFTGTRDAIRKLTASLVVDDRKIRAILGWSPPWRMDQGLAATAAWYRRSGADR